MMNNFQPNMNAAAATQGGYGGVSQIPPGMLDRMNQGMNQNPMPTDLQQRLQQGTQQQMQLATQGGYGGVSPGRAVSNLGFGQGGGMQQIQQPSAGQQQPGMNNPYMQAQAQAIINQSNQNLQNNILPGINSAAMATGGYGGSRQGIAQGLAIQGQQQSLNNSLASMYGQSYQNDQNLANQTGIANIGAAAQRYGADKSAAASMYGANKSAEAARYNADIGAKTAARGQDLNYSLGQQQNALGYAGLQNQANIANAGNATQMGIAGLQNNTAQRGQDLNYGLGMAQNQTAQRGQDLNYGANIYNTNAGVYNNAANNATTLNGQNLNYQVGMANANNSANSNLMNFYTNNRQLDQSGARLGMDMVNSANTGYLNQGQGIYNLGLTAQNNAWSPYTGFNSASSPYTGFGTTTNSNNGNAGAGFLGGAIAGGQLYNLFNQPAK